MNITILARQLAEIVGVNQILTESGACAAYAVAGAAPQLVAAPGSVAELSQVLAAAYAAGAVVVPVGGGTQLSWGPPPPRVDLVVRTHRLKEVIEYEPHDLTISVEAGMTLDALDKLLAQHGQMLPLDGPLPQRATIGGLLATAMDGPRRLGYGTSRDLLIGISVVEATGRVSKAGGMVVKNVSGFDMMKLYGGSMGSLAIIASANFKLIPRPRAAATISCTFPSAQAAFRLADLIHESQLVPAAVEYVSDGRRTMDDGRWAQAIAEIQNPKSNIQHLFVAAEGVPAAVERHLRDVERMAQQAGATAVEVVRDEAHAALWARINDLPQTAEVAPDEVVVRLACLPAQLAAALAAAEALRDDGLALLVAARALSGVAYLRLRCADNDRLAAAYGSLGAALAGSAPGAQLVVLAAPPALAPRLAPSGSPPEGSEVMRRIKSEFDPQATLRPFVGG